MEEKHCKWYNDEFCTNGDSPCVADYCPVVEYPDLCKHRETEVDKDINVRSKMVEEMYKSFLRHKFQIAIGKFTYKGLCEHFYDLGYRKIPENAVVMTREEYERLLKEETLCERLGNDIDVKLKYIYELEDKVAQERKETAEKFAERLKEMHDYDERLCDIADKICKKITEGKV